MLLAEQEKLKSEVDNYLATRTTAMADAVYLNSVSEFTNIERLRSEEQVLFRRLPLVLAHASEIVGAGAYITRDVMGVPVLIVRQTDGTAQAFLNACRHRGARLASGPEGCERRFVCPFHAWSYNIDGSLANIPSAEGFSGLDFSTLGLVRLPTEERHGLVWVALTPGLDFDVASFLGSDLDEELGSWELSNLISERMGVATEDANWKLLVNGFLEGYHVGKLHPKSVAPYIRQNMGPFKSFGRHCRLANVRYRYKDQGKPLNDKFLYGVTGMYVLFPNTIVIWHGTHFERYSMFPVPGNPGRSVCHINLLVRPETHADKAKWDENWKLVHGTIFGEDFAMARGAQAGFSAGILDHLILGRNEPCVQHFHQQLNAELGEA